MVRIPIETLIETRFQRVSESILPETLWQIGKAASVKTHGFSLSRHIQTITYRIQTRHRVNKLTQGTAKLRILLTYYQKEVYKNASQKTVIQ